MRKKKYGFRIVALTAAFACALNGPLGAAAAFAAETGKEAQLWKQDAGAGEAIAQENIIKILTVEDLEALARQCSLDQWSAGKYVVLEADLDLTGSDFGSVPTFGGTFDGNGHTISGFSMVKSGDVNGFFRYVQEGAVIQNLTVSGEIAPEGHRDTTGGLAGSNKGTLSGCRFLGTVKGKNRTGGIAGINEAQGRIYNCSFEGDVTGEHYAGGIAGENLGSVIRCKNLGTVNITEVKASTQINDLGLETLGQLNSLSNVPASTDVGGIAGVSSGILQSCENEGEVGYPHTGYNVGGIVGRQSGYLDGCTNKGTVNGRKDVGGIVGQFEPKVTLQFEPGMLDDLYTELEVLQGLIDTTIQDAKGVSSLVSGNMQGLSDSTENVKTATQGLSDSMIGWADENLEAINDFSARLSWAIDQMVPAADAMTASMESMGDAAALLSDALNDGKLMMDSGTGIVEKTSDALETFGQAARKANEAAGHINDALKRLSEALGNDQETQKMIRKLGECFAELGRVLEEDVEPALEALAESPGISESQKDFLNNMAEACGSLGGALQRLGEILQESTVENGSLSNSDALAKAADRVAQAAMALRIAGGAAADSLAEEESGSFESRDDYLQVQRKISGLGKLLNEVSEQFDAWEKAKEEGRETKAALDALLDKLNLLQEEAQDISGALDELEKSAQKEGADSSMDSAVEEARRQLEKIVQTARELAEHLDGTDFGEENPDGNMSVSEEEAAAGKEPGSEEETKGETKGETAAGDEAAGEEKPSAAGEGETGDEAAGDAETAAGKEPGSEGETEKETAAGDEAAAEEKPSAAGTAGSGAEGEADGITGSTAENEAGSGAYYAKESVMEAGNEAGNESEAGAGNEAEAGSEAGAGDEAEAGSEAESGAGSGNEADVNWEEVFAEVKQDWEAAREGLAAAFQGLYDSVEIIGGGLDDLIAAGEYGANAVGTLSRASSKLKDGFYSLSSATSGIRDTLFGLAQQPAIQFTPMDSKITAQKDALDVALDDMTAQIDQLNSTMTVASDVMLADMEAINRQFGVIIRVLKQGSEEEDETIGDRIVDVSDEEKVQEQSEGCVSGCVNEGEIYGDVNVAGIVGSMAIEYDFDPEDDLTKVGEKSTDFSWLTSAVLSGCKNVGGVTAKKDCAGGIVGRMDMGKVSDCESYGAVKSSGGNYVGGIAGASYASIRDSWAKCSLSGADYVGGIAGLGTTVTDCHSLVEIAESSAFAGAIAGKMTQDGELRGNTYVHTKLAAVDGISYAGQAEPVQYEELLSGSKTPEKFKEFELTFTADGEVVSVMKFQYGKGIRSLPEIPAKEGYSAKWPDLDYSCLTFSQTVEAEYMAYESAISAGGDIPKLLVDGSFSSEAEIEEQTQEVTFTDTKGKEHAGSAVTVRVKEPVLEEISYTVHYRLPEEGKRYHLWVLAQNGWEKRDYELDGDYLLLKSEGEEITFLLEAYRIPWAMGAVLAAAAALLTVLIFLIKKRHQSSK